MTTKTWKTVKSMGGAVLRVVAGVTYPWKGFFICLAFLSLLATLHADVFEQEDDPILGLIQRPVDRLLGEAEVKLSEIASSRHLAQGPSVSVASETSGERPKPLYVFGIDLSKSMVATSLSDAEFERYLDHLQPMNGREDALYCLGPEFPEPVTAFTIARSELCRYFHLVERPSGVALWSFGSDAQLVLPRDEGPKGQKYLQVEASAPGLGDPMKEFFDTVGQLSADKKETDFRKLLDQWAHVYRYVLRTAQEVHFIIISDFFHDIGGERILQQEDVVKASEISEWTSRYRESESAIADSLRSLARSGSTLHLAITRGAEVSFRDILPTINESVPWNGYRETRLGDRSSLEAFDFLRAYADSISSMSFQHSPGARVPSPVVVRLDVPEISGAHIRISLASDKRKPPLPFRVAVDYPKSPGHQRQWITFEESYSTKVVAAGSEEDAIILSPDVVLGPREASRYRLLFSLDDGVALDGGERASKLFRRTFAVPIYFKKNLSLYGALTILAILVAAASFAGVGFLQCVQKVFAWRWVGSGQREGDVLDPL